MFGVSHKKDKLQDLKAPGPKKRVIVREINSVIVKLPADSTVGKR